MQVGVIDWLVKEKKNIIRELCYRGEEKHGEKREERQLERERERERDLWEEDRLELMTLRVWLMRREKVKGREKVRKFTMRERRHQKIVFPTVTNEDNIYRRCNTWEKDYFWFFFFEKKPIKNKSYFY